MELPASWGLSTVPRQDGKLDIVGKDDAGRDYRVRTTDTAEVTAKDVQELKEADRESYPNRETGVRTFCKNLVEYGKNKKAVLDSGLEDDLIEAAGPVVHAGLERKGLTVGSTRSYRMGYERIFGGD